MIQNTLHFVLSSTRLATHGDVKLAFFSRWVAGCRNGHYFSSLTCISYPLRWCLKARFSTAARQIIGIVRSRRYSEHIYVLAHVFFAIVQRILHFNRRGKHSICSSVNT